MIAVRAERLMPRGSRGRPPGGAVDDGVPRRFLDLRVGKPVLEAGRDHCIAE